MVLLSVSLMPAVVLGQALSVEQPTWEDGDTWTLRLLPSGKDMTYIIACTPGCEVGGFQGWMGVLDIVNFVPSLTGNSYLATTEWPLEQGKTWTHTDKSNHSDRWQTIFTVAAFESVRVLAGMFDAVRIEGKQCNETQQNICRDFTAWYAPKAKYFVKIAYSGSDKWPSPPRGGRWELLSYRLHSALSSGIDRIQDWS